jgi:DNA replication protein DnaC
VPAGSEPADQYRRDLAEQVRARIPREFRDATASVDDVAGWCLDVLEAWWPGFAADQAISPFASAGWGEPAKRVRWLLLTGPPGTGKTYQAYAAIRAVIGSGIRMDWQAVRVEDLLAELRPRPAADGWADFQLYANTGLLLLDDLGATKDSAWTETTLDRLADYRWSRWLPTIITTNLPVWAGEDPDEETLESTQADRLFSRLAGSAVVPLTGDDRRRPVGPDSARWQPPPE